MSAIWISGEWPILAVGVFVGAEGGGGDSVELHFLHDGFRCGLNVSWASPLKSYRFTIGRLEKPRLAQPW